MSMLPARSQRGRKAAAVVGRSKRTPLARWFWDIDKVLLVLVAVLISIGLIAVAAASPAAATRYSGGGHSVPSLYYFYRQLIWIALAVPVMIGVSMLAQNDARGGCRSSARRSARSCSSWCRSSASKGTARCAGSISASPCSSPRNS